MIHRFALAVALFTLGALMPTYGSASPVAVMKSAAFPSSPPLFSTESAAQSRCPHDTVVWLNIPSGIYHYKGERWYGRTKHGAYACEKEAIAAGDRATENGR